MKDDLNQEVAKELVAQTAGKDYENIVRPKASRKNRTALLKKK